MSFPLCNTHHPSTLPPYPLPIPAPKHSPKRFFCNERNLTFGDTARLPMAFVSKRT